MTIWAGDTIHNMSSQIKLRTTWFYLWKQNDYFLGFLFVYFIKRNLCVDYALSWFYS